jgi:hypothetical protein
MPNTRKPAPKRMVLTLLSGLPVSGDSDGSLSAAAMLALYATKRSSLLAIASLMKLSPSIHVSVVFLLCDTDCPAQSINYQSVINVFVTANHFCQKRKSIVFDLLILRIRHHDSMFSFTLKQNLGFYYLVTA